jgi:hypothetical protein
MPCSLLLPLLKCTYCSKLCRSTTTCSCCPSCRWLLLLLAVARSSRSRSRSCC